jgi:hypothetical protein
MEVNLRPFLAPALIGCTTESGLDGLQELEVVVKTKHSVLASSEEALTAICTHEWANIAVTQRRGAEVGLSYGLGASSFIG